MQNNIFSAITVSTRIIILLLLFVSILVAKSLYLIIFLSLFFIILFILTDKSVKYYIDLLKNVKFWLLFSFITYIIIFRNVVNSFIFIYKLILIILLIRQFSLTINFQSLTSGIKTLLKPLKKIDSDNVSYNIVIYLYFISFYLNSKEDVFSNYSINKKIIYFFSVKYNIIPRLFFAISKLNKLESSLKIKFYSSNTEKNMVKSNIILLVFLILFIVVICKEVIL